MVRNHSIYKIEVRFTQTIHNRDVWGDKCGVTKIPNTEKTYYVVAPSNNVNIATSWVKNRFRHQEDRDLQIVAVTKIELDAFIEEHTY